MEFSAKLKNSVKLSEFCKNGKAIALPFGTFGIWFKIENSVKISEFYENSKAIDLPFGTF